MPDRIDHDGGSEAAGVPCGTCGGAGYYEAHAHGCTDVCRPGCPVPQPCEQCGETGRVRAFRSVPRPEVAP